MKRYDANGMIGTYVRERLPIGDETEFIAKMQEFAIEKAVAYHADARSLDPISGNEKLLEFCRSTDKIEPCFVLSPYYKYVTGWGDLESLLQTNDIRFMRIFPKEHGYTLTSVHVLDMLEIARKLHLNVMIGYNEIFGQGLGESPYFDELCKRFPDVNIILTEVRHRRNFMWYGYLEQHANVYLEMSINDNWLAYEETVKRFGSLRLLWGSNMPFNHPGSSVTMLAYAQISGEHKENIAYKNLQRLIGRD